MTLLERVLGGAVREARAVLRSITTLGRTVAALAVVSWIIGARLDWDELLVLAAGCLVALVAAVAQTFGRTHLDARLSIDPQRVVVGNEAVGQIQVENTSPRRAFSGRIEVPVGVGVAVFEVPSLAGGATWDDAFITPTDRRSIIPVGPPRIVRGDPLGLARRETSWGSPIDLYVHPVTNRAPGFTAGWLRDLEGHTTNDLSQSDVAFHTLREYQPGDDRRHIHWRTSARLWQDGDDMTYMIRQFLDTRRSHLGLVLSTNPRHFADDDEFELAVSLVGSLGLSAMIDGQSVSLVCGDAALPAPHGQQLLDGLAGVTTGADLDFDELTRSSSRHLSGSSVIALVGGSRSDGRGMRAASERFPTEARVLAVRTVPGTELTVQIAGRVTMLELGGLADLPKMLRSTTAA